VPEAAVLSVPGARAVAPDGAAGLCHVRCVRLCSPCVLVFLVGLQRCFILQPVVLTGVVQTASKFYLI